ncbi:MAG: PHP domain-containing protein, partial [Bacteroidales bacterium]|nr:PHP domain-containing protein [Bacteroidales bacterium]
MKKQTIFCLWALSFGLIFTNCSPDPLPTNVDLLQYFGSMPIATGIVNPYNGIDLTSVRRIKGELHVHTLASDGFHTADRMIRAYAEKGYEVVAITDHDHLYNKPTGFVHAEGIDVLVISGSEFTMTHHFNSLFTKNGKSYELTVEAAIDSEIRKQNSILFMNHPGRSHWLYPVSFYFGLFDRFPAQNLVGMEVINSEDNYPTDKETWHKVLTAMSPYRTVYGFANDDSHYLREVGFNENEFLTNDFSEAGIRNAIVNGLSFFKSKATVSRPNGPLPHVNNVVVD